MTFDDGLGDAKQGDVVLVDGEAWVLVSRTCDLVRRPRLAWAMAVHLEEDVLAERGRRPSLAPIPEYEDGHWYADLSTLEHVERDIPAGCVDTLRPGLGSGTHAAAFRRHLGRYLSKPSWEWYVEETVGPVTALAKKRHDKDSPEGRLYRALTDIRLEVEGVADPGPRDHETPRALVIHYIVKTEEGAGLDPDVVPELPEEDRQWLDEGRSLMEIAERWADAGNEFDRAAWLGAYCDKLTEKCQPALPITEVSHSVITEDQFTFQQVKRSAPIEVEHLSYRDDLED